MKIKNKRHTASILLFAASYIFNRASLFDPDSPSARYCCDAIRGEVYRAVEPDDQEDTQEYIVDLMYSVFCPDEEQSFLHFIWSGETPDTEERILGLLLLREMVLNDDVP